MNTQPIGILDSGVGGLSIWKEVVSLLPQESTIYIADTLYCPYGPRSAEEIHSLSRRLVRFLINQNVKLIVLACNTITTTSLNLLREEFPMIPIIGTVPVVKTAAAVSRKKRIGVLSTLATAHSEYQEKLIHQFAEGCVVINKGTDKLVPFVEQGELSGIELAKVLKEELKEFKEGEIDTLALGCSHFPFLREAIKRSIGEDVNVLDSGEAIARQVERVLSHNDTLSNTFSYHHFYTSGDKNIFKGVSHSLLASQGEKLIDLVEYRVMKDYSHKKAGVLGFGVEGQSVTDYLIKHATTVTIYDEKDRKSFDDTVLQKYEQQGVTFIFGENSSLGDVDFLIRSPGIPLTHPLLIEAKDKNIEVTSSTKMFFELCPAPIIGVTGTKGKGTTSSLIYEMLKKGGFEAYLGGNIGVPPLSFLNSLTNTSKVVLELSSFQLQDLEKSPHIAVMLMVTSEHLDYHKDTAEYVDAKRNIIRFQGTEDFAILNHDYPASNESDIYTEASIYQVSREQEILENGCFIKDDTVVLKLEGKEHKIIDTKDILLPGRHNLENVCSAVMAAHLAGVDHKAIVSVLKTFKGLEHRLELVTTVKGVRYYDDSFSTTPETAVAAIEAFSEPEVLILGGSSKGSDFTNLGKVLSEAENVKAIVGIGVEWPRIKEHLEKTKHEILLIEGAKTMHDAVVAASKVATLGDVVILTPACASFDMFKNYKDRGNQFKEEVKRLKDNTSQ